MDSEDLARAVSSLVAEMGGDTDVAFHIDIKDAHVRPSVALRLYHAIRIGVANTLTYAHAPDVWISIFSESDGVVLLLRDDGVGFDTGAPSPPVAPVSTSLRERTEIWVGYTDGGTATYQADPRGVG